MENDPKMIELNTILFDLDGTLIDTEPTAALAVADCFKRWGLSISSEDASYVTGRTWESAFEFLLNKYTLPLPFEEAQKEILEKYRNFLEENLQVVPGSTEAVELLAPHYSLGLVSGSNRKEILWALKKLKLDRHFQIILGAEDYLKS
jgi:beta-phosphoglucomutase-like phosphatase (HAD superfamily)